jgi:uncharacterized membrane protein (DUF485 family)
MSAPYPPDEARLRSRMPGGGYVGGNGAPRRRHHGRAQGSDRADGTSRQPVGTGADWRRLREARRLPKAAALAVVAAYLVFAVLATEASGLMGARVAGHLNVGLGLILLQCAATVLIVWWYARHARAKIDPLAERVRTDLERVEEGR